MDRRPGELGPFVRFFRPHRWPMLLGTAFGLAAGAAALGLMALSGWFISAAAFAGQTVITAQLFNFFYPGIGVRGLAITRTVARYAERVVSHDATFRVLETLRTWCYRRIEPLAPARLGGWQSGDLLNRIVADVDALDNLYLRVLSPTAVAAAMVLVVLVLLGIFSLPAALAAAAGMGLAGFLLPAATERAGRAAGRQLADRTAALRIRIVDGIRALPVMLVFEGLHRHLERLDRADRRLVDTQQQMSRITAVGNGIFGLVSGLTVVGVLYIGAGQVDRGLLSGAHLAMAVLAAAAAFETLQPLGAAYQQLGRTRESARRLLQVTGASPAVRFPEPGAPIPDRYDVTFDGVFFRYDPMGPPALDSIRFTIPQGGRAAVLGQTGAGKSTLVGLLARFWDPQQGSIRIGERDIRELDEAGLRRLMAVVPQQAHLFNATLRENLLLAKPDATEAALTGALEAVWLGDVVAGLPDGLDTWIGEGGRMLSTGQARRLAVARALLQDAPILVLDEPTEGLDNATAAELIRALDAVTAGRTVLLITHRWVDLQGMDRIVVLENGRIVEQGTPAALSVGAGMGGRIF